MMTNEQFIWKYLYGKIKNVYGVAGLMGNLFAESSLNPLCANGVKKLGMSYSAYTEAVDKNMYGNFATDGIAYGLAQWCYKTRKQGLLDLAKECNTSVGDILLQLDYLWKELQSYQRVLTTLYSAKTVSEASDMVMLKYEKPANQSDEAKRKRTLRGEIYLAKYGEQTLQFNITQKTATDLWRRIEKGLD